MKWNGTERNRNEKEWNSNDAIRMEKEKKGEETSRCGRKRNCEAGRGNEKMRKGEER